MNPAKVAVIMYHYVRPIKESQFPNIRGLEFTDFLDHLDYLKNKSTINLKINFASKQRNSYLTGVSVRTKAFKADCSTIVIYTCATNAWIFHTNL
jgi:hypothetical protein